MLEDLVLREAGVLERLTSASVTLYACRRTFSRYDANSGGAWPLRQRRLAQPLDQLVVARRSCAGPYRPRLDEPVARERGDGLVVVRLLAGEDRAQRARAPLAERALEARLLAKRLVAATARRAAFRERADRRSAARARGRPSRRDPSAPARCARRTRCPVRSCTRRTFVSTGNTSSPNAKLRIAAAVYAPTPGSSVRSSGQPRSAIAAAARWRLSARRL